MKKILATLLALASLPVLSSSFAYDHSAGIALGDPTGFSGQLRLRDDKFLDLTAGFELAKGRPNIILNYVIKKKDHFHIQAYNMDLYYGGGLKLKKNLALNAMLGAAHPIVDKRIEVFASAGLSAALADEADLELDLLLGARYLF